jgi:hypothetical protein
MVNFKPTRDESDYFDKVMRIINLNNSNHSSINEGNFLESNQNQDQNQNRCPVFPKAVNIPIAQSYIPVAEPIKDCDIYDNYSIYPTAITAGLGVDKGATPVPIDVNSDRLPNTLYNSIITAAPLSTYDENPKYKQYSKS